MEENWNTKAVAPAYTPPKGILTGMQFGMLSSGNIQRYSTCEVVKHQMHAMKVVKCESILGPSMGTWDGFMLCSTCNMDHKHCLGHIGNIPLALPLFNAETLKELKKLLQVVCFRCCHSLLPVNSKRFRRILGMASKKKRLHQMTKVCKTIKFCGDTSSTNVDQHRTSAPVAPLSAPEKAFLGCCGARQPRFETDQLVLRARFVLEREDIEQGVDALPVFDTLELHRWLSLIPSNQLPFLGEAAHVRPESLIFFQFVVTPPSVRPSVSQTEGSHTYGHDDATLHLKKITKINAQIFDHLAERPGDRASLAIYEFRGVESADPLAIIEYGERVLAEEDAATSAAAEAAEEAAKIVAEEGVATTTSDDEEEGDAKVVSRTRKRDEVVGPSLRRFSTKKTKKKRKMQIVTLDSLGATTKAGGVGGVGLGGRRQQGGGGGGGGKRSLMDLFVDLQVAVAISQNDKLAKAFIKFRTHGKKLKGLRQKTDGKTGRARGGIFGKRAGKGGRAVVTPNTHIDVDEVGIPESFAKNLTREECIHPWNIRKWSNLLREGQIDYLTLREGELPTRVRPQRRAMLTLCPGAVVERHLRNGDMVAINRHPSLWKHSINGHRVRLVQGNTMQLHTSSTSPYNADFDGDEINANGVGNYLARAEVRHILALGPNLISSQACKPTVSFVQDGLLGQSSLSRLVFAERQQVLQMLAYSCSSSSSELDSALNLPLPCVEVRSSSTGERRAWWSGKQLYSCLTPPTFTLVRGKRPEQWAFPSRESTLEQLDEQEHALCILHGQFLYGVLRKEHCGNVHDSIIHTMFLDYGPTVTCRFITRVQRLANAVLQTLAPLTISVGDSVPPAATREFTDALLAKGLAWLNRECEAARAHRPDRAGNDPELEATIRSLLDKIRDAAMFHLMSQLEASTRGHPMLRHGFFEIIDAQAKGSPIDLAQCMLLLGQQNVKSHRIGDKFPTTALTAAARHGFVTENYRQGVSDTGYWFTSYGGIEGVVATAVKASTTGYIQRRLCTGMRNNIVQTDGTVRNSNFQIISRYYGDDHFDAQWLQKVRVRSLEGCEATFRTLFWLSPAEEQEGLTAGGAAAERQRLEAVYYPTSVTYREQEVQDLAGIRSSLRRALLRLKADALPTKLSSPVGFDRLLNRVRYTPAYHTATTQTGTDITPFECYCAIRWLYRIFHEEKILRQSDRQANLCFQLLYFEYFSVRNLVRMRITAAGLTWLLGETRRLLRSANVVPGESVGMLAGSSIGEPTTQMSFNVHKAIGRVCNLVGGIPRIGEIIDAKKLAVQKSPSDTYYLKRDFMVGTPYSDEETCAKVIASRLCGRPLSELVSTIHTLPLHSPALRGVLSSAAAAAGSASSSSLTTTTAAPDDLAFPTLESSSFQQLAPCVIKIQLQRTLCVGLEIGPYLVAQQIQRLLGVEHALCHSQPDDAVWWVYIRLSQYSSLWQSFLEATPAGESEPSPFFICRTIEKRLLETVHIGGVPKILNAWVGSTSILEEDASTGTLQSVTRWLIQTEGSNFREILAWPEIDPLHSRTTDVHSHQAQLGIASTRKFLQDACRVVFEHTGAVVDSRHLKQMARTMCLRGKISPFTRNGMCGEHKSVWHNIGYEKPTEHLMEASLRGAYDPVIGVAEAVVVNLMAPVGTGSVDIRRQAGTTTTPLVSDLPSTTVWQANDLQVRSVGPVFPVESQWVDEIPTHCQLVPTYSLHELKIDCYYKSPPLGERRYHLMQQETSIHPNREARAAQAFQPWLGPPEELEWQPTAVGMMEEEYEP